MLATRISLAMNRLASLAERPTPTSGRCARASARTRASAIAHLPRLRLRRLAYFPKGRPGARPHRADQVGYDRPLLRAVETVNQRQKNTLFAEARPPLQVAADGLAGRIGRGVGPRQDSSPTPTARQRGPQPQPADRGTAGGSIGARDAGYDPVVGEWTRHGGSYARAPTSGAGEQPGTACSRVADALAIRTGGEQQFRAPDFDEMQRRCSETKVDRRWAQPSTTPSSACARPAGATAASAVTARLRR